MKHTIEYKYLFSVPRAQIINLMNLDMVGRYLPLLTAEFTSETYQNFYADKEKMWKDYGLGPHAIYINGSFAGWGGLQPDGLETDFGLILHPDYWGVGSPIFQHFKTLAFETLNLPSITSLLAPDRPNFRALTRFGFRADGQVMLKGQPFLRFRLDNPRKKNNG